MGTLLLGFGWWHMGQRGFFGASVGVEVDSDVTPWLIVCWLKVVLRGFRRAHPVLGRYCDLSNIRTSLNNEPWEEGGGYFLAFGLKPRSQWCPVLSALLHRYSLATTQFLFGTPSQHRSPRCP